MALFSVNKWPCFQLTKTASEKRGRRGAESRGEKKAWGGVVVAEENQALSSRNRTAFLGNKSHARSVGVASPNLSENSAEIFWWAESIPKPAANAQVSLFIDEI